MAEQVVAENAISSRREACEFLANCLEGVISRPRQALRSEDCAEFENLPARGNFKIE
jgi:hypothetical protein